jgi:hypothetical protein
MDDVTVRQARNILMEMYPNLLISAGCSIHDNGDREYWSVMVHEMKAPHCAACQQPEKVRLAMTLVAETFSEALADIKKQMEGKG